MKLGLARVGGGIALVISLVLLLWVLVGGPGTNLVNLWTIVLCGIAGVLAREVRLGWAAVLLVVGAIPAAVGGVGYLFLPSLVLIALAALVPSQPMHSSH